MIDYFESGARLYPDETYFSFIDGDGAIIDYTYNEARLISAALARKLGALGVRPADVIEVDLPNCPELVFLILASIYGDFTVALIGHSLSEREKLSQHFELERSGFRIALTVDVARASQLMQTVRNLSSDDAGIVSSIFASGGRRRAIMGERQDAIDDTIHFAERTSHLADLDSVAIIMMAGGTSGKDNRRREKLKLVPLTWTQIMDASDAAMASLSSEIDANWQESLPFGPTSLSGSLGMGVRAETESANRWQCVLPLSHISGLQSIVHATMEHAPFRLFEIFDAEIVLHDAELNRATHIAIDDEMLEEMITVEDWRSEVSPTAQSRLKSYKCMLLVGMRRHSRMLRSSYEMGARVYASLGFPETSGMVMGSMVDQFYDSGLRLHEGYEARILDPDEDGFGRLAIKGIGVFDGYLNARTPWTIDHFLITEERALVYDGKIYIRKRSENMFVSAGQNVYPIEIADVLRHIPGITGTHVFGVPHEQYGKIVVAVLESSDPLVDRDSVVATTREWFPNLIAPIAIYVFDSLPRNDRGKLDRRLIESMFV